MKKFILPLLLALVLTACGGGSQGYNQIDAEEAKSMMDSNADVIILDVRQQSEYDEGHIPNAVLFPLDTIDADNAADILPDSDATILIYCRSGNRSVQASKKLAELGYTNLYEFGGINSWPYDIES